MRAPELDGLPHNRARGSAAENAAATWLSERGFEILDRNVTTAAGEIDIVSREGGTLCFVEVKARLSSEYGLAIEAVDRRKQRRLARAAALYLLSHPHEGPCRFDVLGLDRDEAGGWIFTFVRDAFES